MNVNSQSIEDGIIKLVSEEKYEDAILAIMYKYKNKTVIDQDILSALNWYLEKYNKPLFSMEDYAISKALLLQNGLIELV